MHPKSAHLSQRTTAIFLLCLLLLQSCYQGPIITPQVPKPDSNQESKSYITSIATESFESEGLEAKDLSWTEPQGTAAIEDFPQNRQALALANNAPSQALITVADNPLEPLASLPTFTTTTSSHLQSPTIQSSTPIREEHLQDSRKTAAQNRTKFGHSLPSPFNNTPVLPLNTQATGKQIGSSSRNVSKPNQAKLAPARDQQLAHRQKKAAQNRTKVGHILSPKIDQADILNRPLNWKSREGHILLELYVAQGFLRAKVADKFSSQLTYDLPATVFPGISLSELASYSAIKMQQYLHIQIGKGPVLGQVVFSQGGLSGGVKGHKKGKASKEESKEEESSKEEETEIGVVENPILEGDQDLQLQLDNEGLVKKLQDYQEKLEKSREAVEKKDKAYEKLEEEKLAQEAYNKYLTEIFAKQEENFNKQLQAFQEKLDQSAKVIEAKESAYKQLQEASNSKLVQQEESLKQLQEENFKKQQEYFQEKLDQSAKVIEEKENAYKKLQAKSKTKLAQQEENFKKQQEDFQKKLDQSAKVIEEKESTYKKLEEESEAKLAQQEESLKQLQEESKTKLAQQEENFKKQLQEEKLAQEMQLKGQLDEIFKALAPHGEAIVKALANNSTTFQPNGDAFTEIDMAVLVNHPGFQKLTQIDLTNQKLSESSLKILAQNLKGTSVHTIILINNQIGDSGVAELAKNLKGTSVHTIYLGYNQIGASGAAELAKNLKGTSVHTINLRSNQIGASGAAELAKNLKGTSVHTIDLMANQIGASGAAELAKNLKGTSVHTINLHSNQIGASGAAELVNNLKGTSVHTIDLMANQIGASGAAELAKNLKGTSVHTINLWGNQIGNSGAAELAKNLKGTSVHTINLSGNQIGDSGAAELAKNLQGTSVHTINLWGNKISSETQNLLKQQYTNIQWKF
jgi:hypothetical protein